MTVSANRDAALSTGQLKTRRRTVAILRRFDANRRDPDLIARLQLALGLGPAAVDPHLAAAHQLIDQGTRGTLELAQQEIVQPLAGTILGNAHGARAAAGG